MIAAMRQGVVAALEEHRRLGHPVVAWDRETGRIVHIPSDELVIPEVDPASPKSSP